jgi:AraC-like DNA-binding protein
MRVIPDLVFVYVTRGVCEYEDDAGRRRLGPGDMMVLPPGLRHRYGAPSGKEWDERYITCDGPLIDMWQREELVKRDDVIWRLLPVEYWVNRMINVIGDVIAPGPDESLAQLGRLQALLADMRLARRAGTVHEDDRSWLHQARMLLEAREGQARTELESAAVAMNCGYHTFRRRFTQLAGIGPAQYRLQSQINLAQALMVQHPSIGNKELADRCGFADEYHFSKQFKHVTEMAPSAFRDQCRISRNPPTSTDS